MRVLFVSGYGLDSTNANAVCSKKILESLLQHSEIQIDVACDGVVERTPVLDWKRNPLYMLRRIKCWPSYNPNVEKACRQEVFSILSKNKYDCIFVPHKPFETVYAACKAKEQYPDIKLFVYALDPIANEIDANNGLGKHLFFLSKRAEKKVFGVADHVFHMECNRRKYSGEQYKEFEEKFSYLDFPLIGEKSASDTGLSKTKSTDEIILLYSGGLDDVYRSPRYLLDLFDAVSHDMKDVVIHFYAKGNSVLEIEKRSASNRSIKSFGYVPKDELEQKMDEAHFLINIGNKFSEMLPSKLLTYIMSGHPIIHIKNQEYDSCLSYLERYGLFVVIDENDSVEKNAEKLKSFIMNNKDRRIPQDVIAKAFVRNTPRWNAEQIMLSLK